MKLGRVGALLVVFLVVTAGVAAYVYEAYGPTSPRAQLPASRGGDMGAAQVPAIDNPAPDSAAAVEAQSPGPPREMPPSPEIYYRHTGLDQDYGKLKRARPGSGNAPQLIDELSCEVVHVAGGRGLCLSADRGVITTYTGIIFETGTLKVVARVPLAGVPSRCRVARDGRRAALTVFVSGHGYASVDFSTQTVLIDLATGVVEADLETFAVSMDGTPFQPSDRNFWGVTFGDDSRYFYATMATGGEHYLIRGDAEARSARVLRRGVECPSLSPDGRRIAFKQRVSGSRSVHWQIGILDLASEQQEILAENRSVDDQIEWLDDSRVLYSMPTVDGSPGASTTVWVARVDGSSRPEVLLDDAYSPAVLR